MLQSGKMKRICVDFETFWTFSKFDCQRSQCYFFKSKTRGSHLTLTFVPLAILFEVRPNRLKISRKSRNSSISHSFSDIIYYFFWTQSSAMSFEDMFPIKPMSPLMWGTLCSDAILMDDRSESIRLYESRETWFKLSLSNTMIKTESCGDLCFW